MTTDTRKINLQEEIVTSCKNNDRRAQLSLYKQYSKAMYNVCLNIVHNNELAEDLMQEGFISAFKNINTFKGEVTFGAWLKKIVINKCIDYLKKKKVYFEPLEETSEIIDNEDEINVENNITNL